VRLPTREEIYENLNKKSTEELRHIIDSNDRETWSVTALTAIQQILTERSADQVSQFSIKGQEDLGGEIWYESDLERSKSFYRKFGGIVLILFGVLCFLISILMIFNYEENLKEHKLVKESIADKYDRKVDANVGRWVKVTYRNGIEIKRKHLKRDEIESWYFIPKFYEMYLNMARIITPPIAPIFSFLIFYFGIKMIRKKSKKVK